MQGNLSVVLDIECQGESTLTNSAYGSESLVNELTSLCESRFGPTKVYLEMFIFLMSSLKKTEQVEGLVTNDYVTLVSEITSKVNLTVKADKFAMFDLVVYASLGAYDQYRTLCPKCKGEGCSHCTEQYAVKETVRHLMNSEVNAVPIKIVELDLNDRMSFINRCGIVLGEKFYAR